MTLVVTLHNRTPGAHVTCTRWQPLQRYPEVLVDLPIGLTADSPGRDQLRVALGAVLAWLDGLDSHD